MRFLTHLITIVLALVYGAVLLFIISSAPFILASLGNDTSTGVVRVLYNGWLVGYALTPIVIIVSSFLAWRTRGTRRGMIVFTIPLLYIFLLQVAQFAISTYQFNVNNPSATAAEFVCADKSFIKISTPGTERRADLHTISKSPSGRTASSVLLGLIDKNGVIDTTIGMYKDLQRFEGCANGAGESFLSVYRTK